MNQIVIGLAGHIDHGKTSVVQALTGFNTDRLDEEIRRGMTIDIGFAFFDENITLIDVPGHEKFVKNMMAGANSVDAAMLVIAADDGVMPQTREHFDILKLLGVKSGIIVLNKIDLAEDDWVSLVEMDIRDMISNSFLEDSEIVRVSAVQNKGFDQLREGITRMCSSIPNKSDRGFFRMPIDRVFTIRGFGSVTTGTVISGSARLGDILELLPNGEKVKIRNLQSHTKDVNEVNIGDRAAINLQSFEKKNISRGNQLTQSGYLQSSTQLGVILAILSNAKKPIVQNQRIRIHLGTQEVMARVALIGHKILAPGDTASGILKLESPLTVAYSDRFIIRSYSPVITIGGGYILECYVTDKWKTAKKRIHNYSQADEQSRIRLIIENEKANPFDVDGFKKRLGYSLDIIHKKFDYDDSILWIDHKGNKWIVTNNQINGLKKEILEYLKYFHQKNIYRPGASKEEIRQRLQGNKKFMDFLLNTLESEDQICQNGKSWSIFGHSVELSDEEQESFTDLIEILQREGFSSSSTSELASMIKKTEKEAKLLLSIAEQREDIFRLEGSLIFTHSNFLDLKKKVINHYKTNDDMNVRQFKDLANTTRKYAVPLLEYFDKMRITYRSGNMRKLVE